jgi:hypothetical protein
MEQKVEPERNWGVICLHCGRPFPVPFKPSESQESEAAGIDILSRRIFLAWCPACNREAPYSVGEITDLDEPQAVSNSAASAIPGFKSAAGVS